MTGFQDLEKKKEVLTEIAAGRDPSSISDTLANLVVYREVQRLSDKISEITGETHSPVFEAASLKAKGDLLQFAQERLNCQTLKELYGHVQREVFPSYLISHVIETGLVTEYAFADAIMKGYPDLARDAEKIPGGTGAFFKYCQILKDQGRLEEKIRMEESKNKKSSDE